MADKSSGDGVGVFTGDGFSILAPLGYLAGALLAETSTYGFATFASLGTRPGEYVWSWGSGAHADTIIVEVGGVFASPVPEASTWAMTLIGFAGPGYAAIRRRDAIRRRI